MSQVSHEAKSFRFEHFESFLGLGLPDKDSARQAFIQKFPLGTPLDSFEAFFNKIGGKCFLLPMDAPGQLFCTYGHARYPLLPFWPVAITWMVSVDFDVGVTAAKAINIEVGYEGS